MRRIIAVTIVIIAFAVFSILLFSLPIPQQPEQKISLAEAWIQEQYMRYCPQCDGQGDVFIAL